MDICLAIDLDQNKKIPAEGSGFDNRYYEQEAIKCVLSWRKNAGWLKDIHIYGMIDDDIDLHRTTYSNLESFGVEIKKMKYKPQQKFMNTVHSQMMLEEDAVHGYIIHIDLDLYAVKELPREWFCQKVVLARYSEDCLKNNSPEFMHRWHNVKTCHNTFFTINFAKSGFFKTAMDLSQSNEYKQFFKDKIMHNNDWYFFEEGIFDYIDESKAYPSEKTLCLDSSMIDGVYFQHRHLTLQDIVSRG